MKINSMCIGIPPTLELAALGEHKIAKVIQLVEGLRCGSPHVQQRADRQSDQMARLAEEGRRMQLRAQRRVVTTRSV
jgi:hypothetical protein